MLIPHIAYWGTKFLWRGEINFRPTEEWDRFFGDYETWIVQMARVAEAHGAGTFCVGLEFTYAQKFDARWRKIIAAVRQVYHGKLTYGGNWDSFQEVTFWDALDYIGVLAYFPLTKASTRARPKSRPPGIENAPNSSLTRRRMATRNSSSSRSATTKARAPRPSRGPSRWAATTRTKSSSAASRWRSICRGAARPSRGCIGGNGSRNCRARGRKLPAADSRDQSADREALKQERANRRRQLGGGRVVVACCAKRGRNLRSNAAFSGITHPRLPQGGGYTFRPNFFSSSPNEIWIIVGRPCGQQ